MSFSCSAFVFGALLCLKHEVLCLHRLFGCGMMLDSFHSWDICVSQLVQHIECHDIELRSYFNSSRFSKSFLTIASPAPRGRSHGGEDGGVGHRLWISLTTGESTSVRAARGRKTLERASATRTDDWARCEVLFFRIGLAIYFGWGEPSNPSCSFT